MYRRPNLSKTSTPPKKKKTVEPSSQNGLWDYSPKNGAFVRCLCSRCVDAYRNTGTYMVRRLDPFQKAKDTCDRCNSLGWDYVVIEKNSKR